MKSRSYHTKLRRKKKPNFIIKTYLLNYKSDIKVRQFFTSAVVRAKIQKILLIFTGTSVS